MFGRIFKVFLLIMVPLVTTSIVSTSKITSSKRIASIQAQSQTQTQAPAAPSIISIQTSPTVADSDGIVLLPNGSGKLHIQVKAANADSVRFWLTHMEVGSWEDRQLYKEDTNGADGWEVDFPYKADEGFSYELIVEAKGSTAEHRKSIFIHHTIGIDGTNK
ncbi:MAG TPA: hypothetical protein VJ824_03925 [Bacillota bacterium]|nr:hypothetical protein [Bacillota bacterium]